MSPADRLASNNEQVPSGTSPKALGTLIQPAPPQKKHLVIFVPGLSSYFGNPNITLEQLGRLIQEDLPDTDSYFYKYLTTKRKLGFWKSVHIEKEAENLAQILNDCGRESVFLVGQGLGGILCLTGLSSLVKSGQTEILSRVSGLVLIGVTNSDRSRLLSFLNFFLSDIHVLRSHRKFIESLRSSVAGNLSLDEMSADPTKATINSWGIFNHGDPWSREIDRTARLSPERKRIITGGYADFGSSISRKGDAYKWMIEGIATRLMGASAPEVAESNTTGALIEDAENLEQETPEEPVSLAPAEELETETGVEVGIFEEAAEPFADVQLAPEEPAAVDLSIARAVYPEDLFQCLYDLNPVDFNSVARTAILELGIDRHAVLDSTREQVDRAAELIELYEQYELGLDKLRNIIEGYSIEVPAWVKAEPDSLPQAVYSYAMAARQIPVVLPTRTLPYAMASISYLLFDRSTAIDEIIADLLRAGHALVVGGQGTGKTVLGLRVADVLIQGIRTKKLGTRAKALEGIQVYYCSASDGISRSVIPFLDRDHPTLLIVDDSQEDEEATFQILSEWRQAYILGRCQRTYLLFLSQPYSSEEDEYRTNNLFHQHAHVISSQIEPDEFVDLVKHLWQQTKNFGLLPYEVRKICRFSKGSIGVAALTAGMLSEYSIKNCTTQKQFNEELLKELRAQYRIEELKQEASYACFFAYYNIPVHIETFEAEFGAERIQKLLATKFIVRTPFSPDFANVVIRSVAELWLRAEQNDLPKLSSAFIKYIDLSGSNYHQVLSGIRRMDDFPLLDEIIKSGSEVLLSRLYAEKDVQKAALALECIAASGRDVARLIVRNMLRSQSLAERIAEDEDIQKITRFLMVVTDIDHHCFAPNPEGPKSPDLVKELEILERIIDRSNNLIHIADLCNAIGSSSLWLAHKLIARTIENRSLMDQAKRIPSKDLLLFAGRISRVDRRKARQIVELVNENQFVNLLLDTIFVSEARYIVRIIVYLNESTAVRIIQQLIGRDEFDDWVSTLVLPPINLYDLAVLISDASRINYRLGADVAERFFPFLEEAVLNDQRLSAIGRILLVLRRVSWPVARKLLSSISSKLDLNEKVTSETSPKRVGITLSTISRINRLIASNIVEPLTENNWAEFFLKAQSLKEVKYLIKGATAAANNPDKVVDEILRDPRTEARIRSLANKTFFVEDLSDYIAVVSGYCSLSLDRKNRLLGFIDPKKFLSALNRERDARIVGQSLCAYSIGSPREAYYFTMNLAENNNHSNLKRLLLGDVASTAHLLVCANHVNGFLGDKLGELTSEQEAFSLLDREPRLANIAQYLIALSAVAPVKAQKLTRQVIGRRDFANLIEAAGGLRNLTLILTAIHVSDRSFYRRWLRGTRENPAKREAAKNRILSLCLEESNLDTLSGLLPLIADFDSRMAQDIIGSLDKEWIKTVANWENQIDQVLRFVATLARVCANRPAHFPDQKLLAGLAEWIPRGTLGRFGEIRSLEVLLTSLIELLRASDALNRPDIAGLGWKEIKEPFLKQMIDYSDNIITPALISFLLASSRNFLSAKPIEAHARQHTLTLASEYHVLLALQAIALVGGDASDIEAIQAGSKLRELEAIRTWEIGFTNWLSYQRSHLVKSEDAQDMLVGSKVSQLEQPQYKKQASITKLIEDECKRSGGNLRFAFTVAFIKQMNLPVPELLSRKIANAASDRSQWEGRAWVQSLLDEAKTSLYSLSYNPRPFSAFEVAACVRSMHRVFDLAGIVEEASSLRNSGISFLVLD